MADNAFDYGYGFATGRSQGGVLNGASNIYTGNDDWSKNLPAKGVTEPGSDTVKSMVDTVSQKATDLKHDIGGALYNARTAGGADEGQPAPDQQQGVIPAPAPAPDAQTAGSQAVADANQQQKQATQQVADSQQKGGNLVPDANKDPVGHLAQRNQNVSVGAGDATGTITPDVPKVPTVDQQKNAQLDQTGKESAIQLNKINWWESRSFNEGLLAFGLNILSGNSLAQSFSVGSQIFDQHYGAEQREAWRDDLVQKGYDPLEVQRYIDTGDNKVLTSPQQRAQIKLQQQQKAQMEQLQMQGQQLQNQKAAYELSPAYLKNKEMGDQIDRQYKLGMLQQMQFNQQNKQEMQPYQIQKIQAQTQAAQARAAQAKSKIGMQITDPSGNVINASPVTLAGGWHPVLNSAGSFQKNNQGMIWAVNNQGQGKFIAGNTQAAEAALTSANRSINYVNKFDLGGGTSLFGPQGDLSRGFGDFWGQRSNPNFSSRINQLQDSLKSAVIAKLTMELGGQRPTNVDVEEEVQSLGRLTDKEGKPLDINSDRAGEILQSYRQYLAPIAQQAQANVEGTQSQVTPQSMENAVAAGTTWTAPNGAVYRASRNGVRTDQSIWQRIQ